MGYKYIDYSGRSRALQIQGEAVQELVNDTLHLLAGLGMPIKNRTPRSLERTALSILAIIDVKSVRGWSKAKDLADGRKLTTREIIAYRRSTFSENISAGSYDDVRREDLKHVYLAGFVQTDDPTKDPNNPTRRYGLNPEFSPLVRGFRTRG